MKTREEIVGEIVNKTKQELPQLTNYRSGGVFRSFIEVVASFLEKIYQDLQQTLPNRFLQTAQGEWLDLKAEELNLVRNPATKTRGYIIFSREDISHHLIIDKNKIIKTSSGLRYKTIHESILNKNESTTSTLVEAEYEGSIYNVFGKMITEFVTPIDGIDAVTNTNNWISNGGQDIETDEQLRARCFALWSGLSGANKGAYISWAKSIQGVGDVRVLSTVRGLGTVDIICVGLDNTQLGDDILNAIRNEIDFRKPIGTNVVVKAPQELILDINLSVVMDMDVEIDRNCINNAIELYFKDLKIGYDVEPSAIVGQVFNVKGVKSVVVHTPLFTRISELQIARLGDIVLEISNSMEK